MVASLVSAAGINLAKVLVLGTGGREHAVAVKLAQSPRVQVVYVKPGNGAVFPAPPISVSNVEDVISFCKEKEINLVVIGPEDFIFRGYSDELSLIVPCFAPSKAASKIEWSKSYAKEFMKSAGIPTADFRVFRDFSSAREFISSVSWDGIVVKANGLAAGKGVTVSSNKEDAILAAKEMLTENKFGDAGQEIVIEERLYGDEVSALCFTDGKTVKMLPLVRDYKRLLDNDKGLNTGGMGVVGPVCVSDNIYSQLENICVKTVSTLHDMGHCYRGVLYVGVMITTKGVLVLEYNCRFGDPEAQVLMRLLQTDLYDIMYACCFQKLSDIHISFSRDSVCGIVVASKGYPEKPMKGAIISGLSEAERDRKVVIYQAGTQQTNKGLVVNGGRVLCVTAIGATLKEARDCAYLAVKKICFEGMHYRKDIGNKYITKPLAYADGGVDIDEGNQLVNEIKALCSQMKKFAVNSIGGFSAAIDFDELDRRSMGNSKIEVGVDGVGTKLLIADKVGYFEEIGQDLVAMCANDVMCHLAEPVLFLFYYPFGQPSNIRDFQIINSIEAASTYIGCSMNGEANILPQLYAEDQWDIAGACIGSRCQHSRRLPLKDEMAVQDVLIGIASNGLHSNGFSLVRKIFSNAKIDYATKCPWDKNLTFGHVLLRGTRLYTKTVLPIIAKKIEILGIAHITGGGLKENVDRILPNNLKAVINCDIWEIPEIFKWICRMGPVKCEEMVRTFNCGVGMVLVCKLAGAEEVMRLLNRSGERAFKIGELRSCSKGEAQVEFVNLKKAFDGLHIEALPLHRTFMEDCFCTTIEKTCEEDPNVLKTKGIICGSVSCERYCTCNGKKGFLDKQSGMSPVTFINLSSFRDRDFGNSDLVATIHGIGAKLLIALEMGAHYEDIGRSLVALCADEVVCYGAKPVGFLDYYVTGKLYKDKAFEVVKAIAVACDEIGCFLVGGETAEMPEAYNKEQWDLAGVCIGARNLQWPKLPIRDRLKAGNVIIGMRSESLRSSGFSLVHKIFNSRKINYFDKCPWNLNKTLGDVLIGGTGSYAKAVLPVVSTGFVLSAAVVEEGGLEKCFVRMLPSHLKAIIDCAKWKVPNIFGWLKSVGRLSFKRMVQNFNCGIGMVFICEDGFTEEVLQLINEKDENALVIGKLENKVEAEEPVEYVHAFKAFEVWYGNSKLVNVAVMISGTGTNMEKLIESCIFTESICRIVLVISNRADAKGLKVAKNYGIETVVVPFVASKQRRTFEESVSSYLETHSVDLICLAGFMRILSSNFVKRYHRHILNIHPSLLPSFKGAHAIENTLKAGVKQSGCTVHYVTEEVDSGEIIAQESVPVFETDTVESLRERIQMKEHLLFPYAMHEVARQIAKEKGYDL